MDLININDLHKAEGQDQIIKWIWPQIYRILQICRSFSTLIAVIMNCLPLKITTGTYPDNDVPFPIATVKDAVFCHQDDLSILRVSSCILLALVKYNSIGWQTELPKPLATDSDTM